MFVTGVIFVEDGGRQVDAEPSVRPTDARKEIAHECPLK